MLRRSIYVVKMATLLKIKILCNELDYLYWAHPVFNFRSWYLFQGYMIWNKMLRLQEQKFEKKTLENQNTLGWVGGGSGGVWRWQEHSINRKGLRSNCWNVDVLENLKDTHFAQYQTFCGRKMPVILLLAPVGQSSAGYKVACSRVWGQL